MNDNGHLSSGIRPSWIMCLIMIVFILMLGFVVPHLKATTVICSTPSIQVDSSCPSNCDPICGDPENNPSCQVQACKDQRCNLEWYWICLS